ncbi:pheromone processing endoprotease [Phlyctochytrium planicorne]|nr:pheromone processing endoprotease [Phlyctochytrium planicorne]
MLSLLAFLIWTPAATGVEAAVEQWAVRLHHSDVDRPFTEQEAEKLAFDQGFIFRGQVGDLDGYFLFEANDNVDTTAPSVSNMRGGEMGAGRLLRKWFKNEVDKEHLVLGKDQVQWFQKQTPRRRYKRAANHPPVVLDRDLMGFQDPQFPLQWHLFNDGSNGLIRGNDINVIPVWRRGINGTGVTVAIIDDGVEFTHPDFDQSKWSTESSYDFNERSNSPLPQGPHDVHGTRCAGERLISESTTDAVEAQALNYKNQINDIYSSSWGPNDDGASVDGPGFLGSKALVAGIERGRGGKGSIFVFASGNGGSEKDNCNFDGYANSVYTVSIGAINNLGKMPPYGEICAAHLGVTYSGGAGVGIWTTDVDGKCTGSHSGTSAAAPIASGIIALMLSARPELRWRDIQQIIVDAAQPTDPSDHDWVVNGAGKSVSHKYGFGRLDADLLVRAAEAHDMLPPQQVTLKKFKSSNVLIPISRGSEANPSTNVATDSVEIWKKDARSVRLSKLEHVQITVRIRHPARKHLTIQVVSPSGTHSLLATPRRLDNSTAGFDPWTFMTVRNWGENPVGKWQIVVHDERSDDGQNGALRKGELVDWTLTLRGTCLREETIMDSRGQVSCLPAANKEIRGIALTGAILGFLGLLTIWWMLWRNFSKRRANRKASTGSLFGKFFAVPFRSGTPSSLSTYFSAKDKESNENIVLEDVQWSDIESPVSPNFDMSNLNKPFDPQDRPSRQTRPMDEGQCPDNTLLMTSVRKIELQRAPSTPRLRPAPRKFREEDDGDIPRSKSTEVLNRASPRVQPTQLLTKEDPFSPLKYLERQQEATTFYSSDDNNGGGSSRNSTQTRSRSSSVSNKAKGSLGKSGLTPLKDSPSHSPKCTRKNVLVRSSSLQSLKRSESFTERKEG